MEFYGKDVIRIEDKGKEPDILSYAIAFGDNLHEAMEEGGVEIPERLEQVMGLFSGSFEFPAEVTERALKQFKKTEVVVSPRDITDDEEFSRLILGLGSVVGLLQDVKRLRHPFKERMRTASIGGDNGRKLFVEHGSEAPKYFDRIFGRIMANRNETKRSKSSRSK